MFLSMFLSVFGEVGGVRKDAIEDREKDDIEERCDWRNDAIEDKKKMQLKTPLSRYNDSKRGGRWASCREGVVG